MAERDGPLGAEKGDVVRDVEGEAVRMRGVILDVTDRKKTEEDLALLSTGTNQVYDSIVITDKNGIIKHVNPGFEKETGYSREEVREKTTQILKSGKHPDEFYERLWKTILEGENRQGEIINRHKNGKLFYEEMTITPVKIGGRTTHFVAIKRDISEKKRPIAAKINNKGSRRKPPRSSTSTTPAGAKRRGARGR